MKFNKGQEVRDSSGRTGVITQPKNGNPERVYIRWKGRDLSSGYRSDSLVIQGLKPMGGDVPEPRNGGATSTDLGQAISGVLDEVQESFGIYLEDYANEISDGEIRINEVSAELQNASDGQTAEFTVKTSDGQDWTVRVTPKA